MSSFTSRFLFQRMRLLLIASAMMTSLLVGLLLPLTILRADDPTFPERIFFGVRGDDVPSLAVGDMNGDGHLDVVAGSVSGSRKSTVYLNDKSGAFASPLSVPFGPITKTLGLAVADMDGDGDLDMITGNSGNSGGQVLLYLNDGHASWPITHPIGAGDAYSPSIAVGDMNGDGSFDIVVGNSRGQNLVYLNDSEHTFTKTPPIAFGSGKDDTRAIAIGDLNEDGLLDIVAGNDANQNAVYLNDGQNHFSEQAFGLVNPRTRRMVLGDFDGDSHLDIIISTYVPDRRLSKPHILYLNDGHGYFAEASSKDFGDGTAGAWGVAAGDLDMDGDLDFVAGNPNATKWFNAIYWNNGQGHFDRLEAFGPDFMQTRAIALADLNEDGALDIISGNRATQNAVYFNDGAIHLAAESIRTGGIEILSLALGDLDADYDFDLVTGVVSDTKNKYDKDQDIIFINLGGGFFQPVPFAFDNGVTSAVAVADVDNDGDLDIITGNTSSQNLIYGNDGNVGSAGNFSRYYPFGPKEDKTTSLAVGDLDHDGFIDIVTGRAGRTNILYFNDGHGKFEKTLPLPPLNKEPGNTSAIAVDDINGDGALDIAVVDDGGPNGVYLNDGEGYFSLANVRRFGTGHDYSHAVAIGDVNHDYAPDIIVGNFYERSVVYLNDGKSSFPLELARPFGNAEDRTSSISLGDINNDGNLDIITGNWRKAEFAEPMPNIMYINDGNSNFTANNLDTEKTVGYTNKIIIGDIDNNGSLDVIAGNRYRDDQFRTERIIVYRNRLWQPDRLPNRGAYLTVSDPVTTSDAPANASPIVIERPTAPFSYTLYDPEGDPVGRVVASFSLDGGSNWQQAIPTTDTITTNLTTSPHGTTHVYTWDAATAGIFGQYNDVVLRLRAYSNSTVPQPGAFLYTNTVSGPYQRTYVEAATVPFRLRPTTQVRVYSQAMTSTLADAVVYRQPSYGTTAATVLADDAGVPFRTLASGYLAGHGALRQGDKVVALWPSATITGTAPTSSLASSGAINLFHTSAEITQVGLELREVSKEGVQSLAVSPEHSLLLFDLDVALEWDARNDKKYRQQLELDLRRASELLHDWTNGQVALGQVHVYYDARRFPERNGMQPWRDADLRIYATNRMRPNATQGGIITDPFTDPVNSSIVYGPGLVQMGAVWNRFGESTSNLAEDWPRTLAHELGHYLLFLGDNYIGKRSEKGLLEPIIGCPGAMADPYKEDDAAGNGELTSHTDWETHASCGQTLSAWQTQREPDYPNGRSDWDTIATFYPWLKMPEAMTAVTSTPVLFEGPSALSIAVTQIVSHEPPTKTAALEVPVFYTTSAGKSVQASPRSRAFLFKGGIKGDLLIDLGRPQLDQVVARGAEQGDRVCVLDQGKQGCYSIGGGEEIAFRAAPAWPPEIIIAPAIVTSALTATEPASFTIDVSIAFSSTFQVGNGGLCFRLYPIDKPAEKPLRLTPTAQHNVYTGTLALDTPILQGYIHVWDNAALDAGECNFPLHDAITDFTIGGNPGLHRFTAGGAPLRPGLAPAVSGDGQVMLYRDADFAEGEFITLQSATKIPDPPPWATVVGEAYYLLTSSRALPLGDTVISFNYLGNEIPTNEERWLGIYFWDEERQQWQPLDTVRDTDQNHASAFAREGGLYALFSTIALPLSGPGWNLIGYPVVASRSISVVLAPFQDQYSIIYGFDPTKPNDSWQVFASTVPTWVNSLSSLEFGQGYLIHATASMTLNLKGGFATTMSWSESDSSSLQQQSATATSVPLTSLQVPPAIYYGWLKLDSPLPERTSIMARIDNNICGQSDLYGPDASGIYTFTIPVKAAGTGVSIDCGNPGDVVVFTFTGGNALSAQARWDNTRVQELKLSACRNLIHNGNFEDRGGWFLPSTRIPARIVTDPDDTDNHFLQLGAPPDKPAPCRSGRSIAQQSFSVPAQAAGMTLDFSYRSGSTATANDAPRTLLLDRRNLRQLAALSLLATTAGGWETTSIDLSAFAGRKVLLSFDLTYNLCPNDARVWLEIDDVRACTSP